MSLLVCRLWVGGDGVTVTQCNIQAGQLVKHLLGLPHGRQLAVAAEVATTYEVVKVRWE